MLTDSQAGGLDASGDFRKSRSELQRHFYEEECDREFEIDRPHNCGRLYQCLIDERFQAGIRLLDLEVGGRSLLEVCCGSGMISEKFARLGARVTGLDFSPSAIDRARERTRRYDFDARFLVGDAETLPFRDSSFDIAAVFDGLHHLVDPYRGIAEMARVARSGVLIMDPAEAGLTRLAIRMGWALAVEEAGNEVKRLSPRLTANVLRARGFDQVTWRRSLMYYPHAPSRWFCKLDSELRLRAFRACFISINWLVGRWGNKLTLSARKPFDARRERGSTRPEPRPHTQQEYQASLGD